MSRIFILLLLSLYESCSHFHFDAVTLPKFQDDFILTSSEVVTDHSTAKLNPSPSFSLDLKLTPERIAALDSKIRNDVSWTKAAINLSLYNAKPYYHGMYGKIDSSTVYMMPYKNHESWQSLYIAMIKILSEKYGCFVKKRMKGDGVEKFICRDQRRIVFWKQQENNWIRFHGKQYDKRGQEIIMPTRSALK